MNRFVLTLLVGLVLAGCQTNSNSTSPYISGHHFADQRVTDSDICSYATSNGKWKSLDSYTDFGYVKEAKQRGLSCGVSIEISANEICENATDHTGKNWESNLGYGWVIEEAKRRGLSCGVGEVQEIANNRQNYWSDKSDSFACNLAESKYDSSGAKEEVSRRGINCSLLNEQSAPDNSANGLIAFWSDKSDGFVCNLAKSKHDSSGAVSEAKKRGLTCGVDGLSTSTQIASATKAKPQATSAALTASQKEAERLRQELAALRADKARKKQTISGDTKIPTITIASADTKGKQGIIRGKARDNTGIAEVTVGGSPITFDTSGNFRFETFVPVGGKQVTIQVTDLNGLSNSKTVKLARSASNTATAITFETLNPLGRKVAKNKDALALIIGIEKYKNTVDAAYADKDALMFKDYATEKLGIPSNRIKTLINNEADISGMLLGVRKWLRRSSKANESDVYVFYAGHGITTPDREAYLFPYDGVTEVLDRTALLQKDLFSEIEKANPRNVTIFLDACYTGKARTGEVLMADAELRPIAIRPIDDGLPDNFTLLTASSGSEFSGPLKEVKQGMFSYYLMKGMEGVADTNQDNKITAGELHAYVKTNVLQQSSDSQTPQLQGDANRVLVQFQ